MAFDVPADLVQLYSAQTTIEINTGSILPNLLDRRWEPELQSAYRTKIPNPTYNTPASAFTRGGDWKTATVGAQTFINFDIDQYLEVGQTIDWLDVVELPINYLDRFRQSQRVQLNKGIEANLIAALEGLVTWTSGTNEFRYGDSTDNLARDTLKPATAAATQELIDSIFDIGVTYAKSGVIGPLAATPLGGVVGGLWCLMVPEIFRYLAAALLDKKYSLDTLTDPILRRQSVFNTGAYQGSLGNVQIFSHPGLTYPTQGSGQSDHVYTYIGVPQAMAFALRPPIVQFITPDQNQTGPDYLLRQIVPFGRVGVNTGLVNRIRYFVKAS